MAHVLQKPKHSGTYSTVHEFQATDYVLWRQSKQKTKPSTLPPVRQANSLNTSKMKTLTRVQPVLHSMPTMVVTSHQPRELHRRQKLDPGKTQAKIRLMKTMLRNRQTSLRELQSHEHFLAKFNEELIESIQDMENSTALNVRATLQQQDILTTVIDILEYLNKKRLQQLKSELQEWEEKKKCKTSYLEQQVERLNAKIDKTQEDVKFLSTYMDHEYSIKSVQIATLVRQLQEVKDSQQDELDDLSEMRRKVLKSLSDKIQKEEKKILSSLVTKTQHPHEKALLQMVWESQASLKCIHRLRKFLGQFEENVPVLRAEVEELQAQIREPREVVFEDVLLRRPKCTPDMDVILNIPAEEPLPF
uniref:Chromosome 20 open reading frame 96 n=1 Tax=Saimiri boliviensis boliviensis TaxID=39432 RepID=A0A2K6T6J2_SAIBB